MNVLFVLVLVLQAIASNATSELHDLDRTIFGDENEPSNAIQLQGMIQEASTAFWSSTKHSIEEYVMYEDIDILLRIETATWRSLIEQIDFTEEIRNKFGNRYTNIEPIINQLSEAIRFRVNRYLVWNITSVHRRASPDWLEIRHRIGLDSDEHITHSFLKLDHFSERTTHDAIQRILDERGTMRKLPQTSWISYSQYRSSIFESLKLNICSKQPPFEHEILTTYVRVFPDADYYIGLNSTQFDNLVRTITCHHIRNMSASKVIEDNLARNTPIHELLKLILNPNENLEPDEVHFILKVLSSDRTNFDSDIIVSSINEGAKLLLVQDENIECNDGYRLKLIEILNSELNENLKRYYMNYMLKYTNSCIKHLESISNLGDEFLNHPLNRMANYIVDSQEVKWNPLPEIPTSLISTEFAALYMEHRVSLGEPKDERDLYRIQHQLDMNKQTCIMLDKQLKLLYDSFMNITLDLGSKFIDEIQDWTSLKTKFTLVVDAICKILSRGDFDSKSVLATILTHLS